MTEISDGKSLKILFTGDIYPGDFRLSDELAAVFSNADYRIGNLEGIMADLSISDAAENKTVLPCVSPNCVNFLHEMGLDYVSLANNHMFDYEQAGLLSNIKLLQDKEIAYSGAGENIEQAKMPHIFEKNGIKVAIVNCASDGTEALYATETQAGCAPLDEDWLSQLPSSLKASGVDHVILYVHWGYCGYSYPLPEHKSLAERLIQSGYTAVIGHHHHQLNGVEFVDGRLIAYGLGDFVFAPYVNRYGKQIYQTPVNCESAVLELVLDKENCVSRDVVFTLQKDDVIELDQRPSRQKDFDKSSKRLLRKPYIKVWKSVVRKRLARRILYWLNPMSWRYIKPKTFNALFIMVKDIFLRKKTE